MLYQMLAGKKTQRQKFIGASRLAGLCQSRTMPSVSPTQSAWTPATPGCTYRSRGLKLGRKSTLKPSSAKAKGRVLQQFVRDLIVAKFGLEPDDVRSVSMGVSGEDLLLSPAARRKLPISMECKSRASISVYGHYQQAIENAGGVYIIVRNFDDFVVWYEQFTLGL